MHDILLYIVSGGRRAVAVAARQPSGFIERVNERAGGRTNERERVCGPLRT